jgi:hypothetical protein
MAKHHKPKKPETIEYGFASSWDAVSAKKAKRAARLARRKEDRRK